jgi:small GTP-binding protein
MKKTVGVKKKICLIGDPAVGKTSLIRKYVTDVFDDKYIGTLGTKVTKKRVLIEQPEINYDLTLAIWDILGQKEFQRIQNMAYRGAKGVFLVCDLTRKETLDNLMEWRNAIEKITNEIPIIILANKCDIDNQAFGEQEIQSMSKNLKDAPFILTSAKTGNNVDEAFNKMGEFVIEKLNEIE